MKGNRQLKWKHFMLVFFLHPNFEGSIESMTFSAISIETSVSTFRA